MPAHSSDTATCFSAYQYFAPLTYVTYCCKMTYSWLDSVFFYFYLLLLHMDMVHARQMLLNSYLSALTVSNLYNFPCGKSISPLLHTTKCVNQFIVGATGSMGYTKSAPRSRKLQNNCHVCKFIFFRRAIYLCLEEKLYCIFYIKRVQKGTYLNHKISLAPVAIL